MQKAIKVLRQLGVRQSFWFGVYRLGLRSGLWRRLTPPQCKAQRCHLQQLLPFPTGGRAALVAVLDITARVRLMAEAEEICGGEVRLFGGPPLRLQLVPPGPLAHWSDYETGLAAWGVEDVKFIWEPARFGWAFTLVRAFLLSGEERFAAEFWRRFEIFDAANPPNMGPNWASGQEVALRLLGLLFAGGLFSGLPSASPERVARLAASAAEHAQRIPPTLSYARAQHNNHLVSEALGLYAVGLCLPGHADARRWKELGWRELNGALCAQIAADGTYAQHSSSYHRLMLQAALLADNLARSERRAWPEATRRALAAAASWQLERIDPLSGHICNLGSNDGANILPLSPGDVADYRAVARAACFAFRGETVLAPGPWDELALWLGLSAPVPDTAAVDAPRSLLVLGERERTWAALRAVRYTSRPAHADQLHVDIWQAGKALAFDAGTYRYNAAPPWDNALARTLVHNTVMVASSDQMTRSGKFLWLDWAQARVLPCGPGEVTAEHDGYRRLGVIHRRTLRQTPSGWLVEDQLLPLAASRAYLFSLHWLLPDWPYTLNGHTLALANPSGMDFTFSLSLAGQAEGQFVQPQLHLVRAGESLLGTRAPSALLGWHSPTYAVRKPALSVVLSLRAAAPLTFTSVFTLADELALQKQA